MKKAVVYARISVTNEESVSVERQVESAGKYAEALGWQVVGQFVDDGVSATKNKPEDRAGWRAVLEAAPQADVVLIWKIDRLARNVSDFMRAQWALEEHGAGLASVTEGLDLTTTIGQMVATNLAYFAQMEAEAISVRVKEARTHLLRAGRVVGGTIQYGWKSVPNPDGPGYVLAQDPDTIDYVRGAADLVMGGASLYRAKQWLDEVGAPLPTTSQSRRKSDGWAYTTLERMLRNPILAGMTLFNPGIADDGRKRRGEDVLRGEDGLPVVDESIAIMEVSEWRALVALLDSRDTPQSKPVTEKAKTSGLLSGLVFCGDGKDKHGADPVRMWRGTIQGRPGYQCPACHHAISNFEDVVVEHFLREKGSWVRWTPVEEVHEGGAALLPEIEHRLDELEALIRNASKDERAGLMAQQATLLDERDARRGEQPVVSLRYEEAGFFDSDWAAASTDAERRAVLVDALDRIIVRRGKPGRRAEGAVLARLDFEWREPAQVGPPEGRSATG